MHELMDINIMSTVCRIRNKVQNFMQLRIDDQSEFHNGMLSWAIGLRIRRSYINHQIKMSFACMW